MTTNGQLTEINIHDLLASKILPENHGQLRAIGQNWFKDRSTGICYRIVQLETGALIVKETRQSIIDHKKRYNQAKYAKPQTTSIKCIDCGEERVIKMQDKFQVKRCRTCQSKNRLKTRKELYYKTKNDTIKQ